MQQQLSWDLLGYNAWHVTIIQPGAVPIMVVHLTGAGEASRDMVSSIFHIRNGVSFKFSIFLISIQFSPCGYVSSNFWQKPAK